MAAPQKHRACNRPGRPFCDKACNKTGDLATNPPCDKPIDDCSTLHRGPRQGLVTEGPQQRFVIEGGRGGPRQTPISSHSHMYIYIYTDVYRCIYSTLHTHTYIWFCIELNPGVFAARLLVRQAALLPAAGPRGGRAGARGGGPWKGAPWRLLGIHHMRAIEVYYIHIYIHTHSYR